MNGGSGCCVVCARTCHKGHDLDYSTTSSFYCDCGDGKGPKACKSLKKPPPKPVRRR